MSVTYSTIINPYTGKLQKVTDPSVASVTWGAIIGTISDQGDLNTALNGKVPNTRTLTINGTAFDLSANRSWTISQVYPGAGIAVSTGSAWGTSITDNSSNWNTAFGWGNHASAGYLTSATAATTYIPFTSAGSNIDLNGKAIRNFIVSKLTDYTAAFQFITSGLSAGATRDITVPNRSFTLDNVTINTTTNLSGLLRGTGTNIATATAGTDYEVPLTFSQSVSRSSNTVTLSGDSATPGNNKYYGTDGSGTKGYFSLGSTTPGGSNTYVQFNDSGAFGGDAGFIYVKGTATATITNLVASAFKMTTSPTDGYFLKSDSAGVASWAAVHPLTTKGDLFTYSTVVARLGVGSNGQVLTADSGETTGIKWATPASGVTDHSLLSNLSYAASGHTGFQATTTFQYSLTGTTTVNLVGDTASPGNNKMYATDGSGTRGWISIPSSTTNGAFQFQIGDGVTAISTTIIIPPLAIPRNATVTKWEVFADASGSIVVDIKKSSSYSGLPTFSSIAGSDKPTLSSVQKNTSSALTGWTTSITAGDWVQAIVSSATTVKQVTVTIYVTYT